jgi:hypothetical protein
MRRRTADRNELARDLASLSAQPLDILKQRWHELYGSEPPKRLGRLMMTRAIAYKIQEQTEGGLKPSVARLFTRISVDIAAGQAVTPPSAVKTGTRLLRQWQGSTHEVIVQEDGVRYRGETYRSLSEVARIITGARWSGPLFFGLKERRRDVG